MWPKFYSLGNFLFDQSAARASGALVEMRIFEQGTVFMRNIPLPNFFDMATQINRRRLSRRRARNDQTAKPIG